MKRWKRSLVYILIGSLLLGTVGCGKKDSTTEEPGTEVSVSVTDDDSGSSNASGTGTMPVKPILQELTGTTAGALTLTGVQKQPADGIGTPGADFTMLQSDSVSGWDSEGWNKAPYFNPLGARDRYDEAEYYEEDYYRDLKIRYLAEDGYTPASMTFIGYTGFWKFYDENVTRNYILYKAREMGAEIYNSTLDTAVFFLQENDTTGWWYVCRIGEGSVTAEYVKINLLPMGKALNLSKAEPLCMENRIYCYSKAKRGKQLTGRFVFDGYSEDIENGLICDLISNIDIGTYSMAAREDVGSYYHMISPREGQEIVVDNVPAAHEWVLWDINAERWNEDYGISLKVEEAGDITPITIGEQPGLVKLIGGGGLGSELIPYSGSYWTGNLDWDNMQKPFMDNEGNYCFSVPAGYYILELGAEAMEGYPMQLQNVPVSAGRITEITLPSETKAFTSDILSKTGSQEADAGNMEIISVKDSGSSAVISVLVHDPEERDVFPSNEDFKIYENGSLGKVTNIVREPAGANVIMCVDSSGSIKKSLPAVIDAACKFVENLPENSTISIIEFKQNLIQHPGNTKEEAIKALKSITAKGDTSLYDAVSTALDRLEGKERAYVIAFTDGVDSREPGDSAPGSAISREDLNTKIKNSNATVLAMGFGPGHNAQYMQDMANASVGGQYYAAADETALDSAFAAVSSKFGNQFTVTYERPEAAVDQASDVPVVSMMMDISGSMNMLPGEIEDSDVDIRLDRVRSIFHDLVMKLPQGSLMQFGTFTAPWDFEVYTKQLLTDSKADVLRALGGIQAGGGTPIMEALDTSFGALKTVNSSKKVLVFFTDAALAVEDDGSGAQILEFENILKRIKEEGVRVLFAGLGGKDYAALYQGVFQHAAEMAGGEYVITDNVDEIRAKVDTLLAKVNEPTAVKPGVKILVDLDAKTEDGSRMAYSAVKTEEKMVLRTKTGAVTKPGRVTVSDGGPYITYGGETSKLLYGSDNVDETVLQAHITFEDAVASNQFADVKVTDAYVMSRYKGLEAPYGSFLALNVELTFHKKDKSAAEVGYQIPNMFNHCYVSMNNGRMMPVSEATYLAEKPFMTPGESAVQVNELKNEKGEPLELGETISGVLVFTVEGNGDWEQLSLHIYDTSYGHLELALVGALPKPIENIAALPTSAPANIAQSFDMKLIGSQDTGSLAGYDAPEFIDERTGSVFRTLEMSFNSKVQALLDIDPTQRFYLSYPTNSGTLLTKMSDVVYNVPLGFTGKTKFAPGSETKVRLPYVIPESMVGNQSALWGEIAGGSFEMPVTNGTAWNGASEGLRYEHEYFTLVVNQIGFVDDHRVALDFTVIDKKDGEGTAGFETALLLQRNVDELDYSVNTYSTGSRTYITAISRKGLGSFGDQSDLLEPIGLVMADTDATAELVFGASDAKADWGAYDGQSRRGVLLYNIPSDGFENKWRLTCEFLLDLDLEIGSKKFTNTELLAEKPAVNINTGFEDALAQKVDAAVANYRATHPTTDEIAKVGLTDDEIIGNHIETPYLTAYGSKVLEEIDSLETFYSVMNSLTWLPSDSSASYYAPESVLTQGWGSDADFYLLSEKVLMRLGYQTEVRRFEVTDIGRENLKRLGGYEMYTDSWVYAIGFTDEYGKKQMYVPAFRYTADSLGGLGYVSTEPAYKPETAKGEIFVRAYGELKGNAGMGQTGLIMAGFADIFGGGDGDVSLYESVDLLNAEVDLTQLGRNPMDISFVSLGKTEDGIHDKITAAADTTQGLLKSETMWVNSADYDFDRVEVIITGIGPDYYLKHTYMLNEGDSLLDIFKTVGVNLPTMKDAAVTYYQKLLSDDIAAFGSVAQTDYGVCRWTTHSMIAKMVKTFTDYEKESCATIHAVPASDSEGGFSFAATLRENNGNADASMDIMHASHYMLSTKESDEKGYGRDELQRAHNLAMGTYASTGEGSVVKGGETIVDIWNTLPANAGMITVDSYIEERLVTADFLEQQGAPAYLLERLRDEELYRGFIVPTAAGKLQGSSRWGWMEINPETMEVISVFDNGERGMAAYVVGLTPKGAAEFTVGAMIGMACSNFSVAAYALETENPEEIMVSAYMLTNYCLDQIKFMSSGMDDAKKFATDGAASLAWDKIKGAFTDRIDKDVMDAYKKYKIASGQESFGQEPTFADGFEAAMKLYFFGEVDW